MCITLCALRKWLLLPLPYTFPSKDNQLCNMAPIHHPSASNNILPLPNNHSLRVGWRCFVDWLIDFYHMHSTLTMHGDWMIAFLASFFPDKQHVVVLKETSDQRWCTNKKTISPQFCTPSRQVQTISWRRSFHVPRQRQPTNRSTLPSKTSLWHSIGAW